MKEPYSVLGMDKSSSREELTARYESLKKQYSEDRFKSGDAGNEGAKNLSELEAAWGSISADLSKNDEKNTFGSDFGAIDDLIKKSQYDEAQSRLDSIADRNAEWHYLQSIIYYKREWISDSRKQLVMATNLEPNNAKYKTALEKLDMVMGNPNQDPRTIGVDPNAGGQTTQNPNGQMNGANCLSNCCLAYCLTDCCCSMTRCC